MSQDDADDLEMQSLLEDYFSEHDRVDDLSIETSRALFGLRRVDELLAELVETVVSTRDDAPVAVVRFERDDVSVVVETAPGRIDVAVTPPPSELELEGSDANLVLDVDAAGGATGRTSGVVRIRAAFEDGRVLVTDPVAIPPPV